MKLDTDDERGEYCSRRFPPEWSHYDTVGCDRNGGSEWESNPPATGNLPPAGFEDREDHRTPCASISILNRGNRFFEKCQSLSKNPVHLRRTHLAAAAVVTDGSNPQVRNHAKTAEYSP